jgi:flagellar protein FliS
MDPRRTGPYAQAQQAYTESAVLTAEPAQLICLLYKGAIRFTGQAAAEIEGGHPERCWNGVRRAQAILDELNFSLDMSQGDISDRLRSIYLFCKRQLTDGALGADAGSLRTVMRLLAELLQSWEQVTAAAAAAAVAQV